MALPLKYHIYALFFLSFSLVLESGCETTGQETPLRTARVPVEIESRFLLTFDDGPAFMPIPSPTASILDKLKHNSVQPDIKAIFFLQTRAPDYGGSKEGRRLMKREQAEGHILAIHSGSVRGHVSHTSMKPEELQQSLVNGTDDITSVAGQPPLFVRPPYWRYNPETFALYEKNGLRMILTDVKAYDGVKGVLDLSTRRQGIILSELQRVRTRISRGELPVVNNFIPIVVTFHDKNSFTASHLEEYLQILVKEAGRAGLRMSSKPFYDNKEELETAALKRTVLQVLLDTRLPARIKRSLKGN